MTNQLKSCQKVIPQKVILFLFLPLISFRLERDGEFYDVSIAWYDLIPYSSLQHHSIFFNKNLQKHSTYHSFLFRFCRFLNFLYFDYKSSFQIELPFFIRFSPSKIDLLTIPSLTLAFLFISVSLLVLCFLQHSFSSYFVLKAGIHKLLAFKKFIV